VRSRIEPMEMKERVGATIILASVVILASTVLFGDQHERKDIILAVSTAFMVALQVIIVVATSKVWRQHYPAHRFSHAWVVGIVQAVWWVLFFSCGFWFMPA
nr:hypothetical protein [Candidatus Sigynarchaeota archaeon]